MSFFDQIKVYKKIFLSHEFIEFCDQVSAINWNTNLSSKNYDTHKVFWGATITDHPYFSEFVFGKIKNIIGDDYKLHKILGNAHSSLQPGSPHVDHFEPNNYTFLIYANKKWDYTWGGHTLFFNRYWDTEQKKAKISFDEDDEVKCIFPIPNTAVFFPANILHFAEAPTRDFYGVRYSVAFKLEKIK